MFGFKIIKTQIFIQIPIQYGVIWILCKFKNGQLLFLIRKLNQINLVLHFLSFQTDMSADHDTSLEQNVRKIFKLRQY